jgi:hypothetical protein
MALHPVERAARGQSDFVTIHPFRDGNGRTSRLLMNLELMKGGPPAVPPPTWTNGYPITPFLNANRARVKQEPSVLLVARIEKEGCRPHFHALGLPVEEELAELGTCDFDLGSLLFWLATQPPP